MRAAWLLPMALALAAPSVCVDAAPKERPAINLKTRAATITVTVEKTIEASPGLAADLLAEGQKFAAKARAEAEEEYKTNREYFTGGRGWSYERVYAFRSL